MIEQDREYYMNNPVFVKFKKRFDLLKLSRVRSLKKVAINERIAEIPFAIRSLESVPRGGAVLDLGCVESVLPLYLASLGYRVTGLDFRDHPYVFPNFEFQKGDILHMPFSDERFDAALCVSTLEHIGLGYYADPKSSDRADQKAIGEILRVLKKQGVFVLTVPYGVKETGRQQRVYDDPALGNLLESFRREEVRFFRSLKDDSHRNNFWKEIGQEEASHIRSKDQTTCVCLVKAVKAG